MTFFDLREPISSMSHGLWLVLSIPATILLLWRCGHDKRRRLSFLVYGLSMSLCYAGSAVFHGVQVSHQDLDIYDRLDHVGIFLLIAGSYTPLAWNLMRARWRFGVLASAWGVAAIGSMMILSVGVLPPVLNTAVYLGMGWGAIFCYMEVARFLSHRRLFPLLLGGVLYSIGAVINLAHWPVIVPGAFGPHEIFHLFVMAGSLAHYLFMLRVVLPASPVIPAEPEPRPVRAPGRLANAMNSGRAKVQPIRLSADIRPRR